MAKVGWIGTGVMGASMAGHLQAAGHTLFLHNRSSERAQPLLEKGAHWCESPAEVGASAEIVFSIVGHPEDVRQVYLGESGVLGPDARCHTVVDMTSSLPSLAKEIADVCESRNIGCLDAPVSGGDVGARQGTLVIMVGGKRETFERTLPFFEVMGKTISYFGEAGSGQNAKVCNQIVVSGTMAGMCEALVYASRQGLDEQQVIDVVGQGAAGSWAINNLGPRIVKGDFAPGFFVEHFIKDMDIALKEARAIDLSLPGLALVHQLYVALKAQGHGRSGTQALYLALKHLNGEGREAAGK